MRGIVVGTLRLAVVAGACGASPVGSSVPPSASTAELTSATVSAATRPPVSASSAPATAQATVPTSARDVLAAAAQALASDGFLKEKRTAKGVTEVDRGGKIVIEPLDTTRTAEYALPDRSRVVFEPGSTFVQIGSSSWQLTPDGQWHQNSAGSTVVIDLNYVLTGKLASYAAPTARLEVPIVCPGSSCWKISAAWDTTLRPPTKVAGVMLIDSRSYRLLSVVEVETYPDGQKIDRTSTFFDHAVPVTILPPTQ